MRACLTAWTVTLLACGGGTGETPDAAPMGSLPDSAVPVPVVQCRDTPELLVRSSFDNGDSESISGLSVSMTSGALLGVDAASPCGEAFQSNNGWGDYETNAGIDATGDSDFSLSVWVRTTQAVNTFPNIVSKEDLGAAPARTGYSMILSGPGVPGWYFETFSAGVLSQTGEGPAVNDGMWHHLVATRAEGQLRIYTDGVSSGQVDGPSNDITNGVPLRLAAKSTANGGSPAGGSVFDGELDEFRMYRRALDEGEVLTLYEAQNSGDCTCFSLSRP